ncbi:MAG: hypothetical protein U1E78_12040 [Gammaproteobacteria bacterium]
MNDLSEIIKELLRLSPSRRLKFLRQKIIKKNQTLFCQDGIIRQGTLKSIESEKLKISPRIAEKLAHKMALEGITCSPSLFLDPDDQCNIQISFENTRIIGPSLSSLEEIRLKLSTLTPLHIDENLCPELCPNGATALGKLITADELINLNHTLCLVRGSKIFIAFLTYDNHQIISKFNSKTEFHSINIINFCELYAIDILYFKEPEHGKHNLSRKNTRHLETA